MKKWFALFLALLMLLSLAACGEGEEAEETEAEELTRSGMPEDADPAPEDEVEEPEYLDWDLSICQPEEAYRELEHYNIDPTGYRGLRLRVAGEFFVAYLLTFLPFYLFFIPQRRCLYQTPWLSS